MVAPTTGFPLTSVALTVIGWKACRVADWHTQATWPLPATTVKAATNDVCAGAIRAPDKATIMPAKIRDFNLGKTYLLVPGERENWLDAERISVYHHFGPFRLEAWGQKKRGGPKPPSLFVNV